MRLSIALAQVNPTVGDVQGNLALVRRSCRHAARLGADLVVFPELVLVGYPGDGPRMLSVGKKGHCT